MSTETLKPFAVCESGTDVSHRLAVERVIRHLHQRLHEPLTLQQMSSIATFSPFHFNRVFHHVTGLPPGQFLSMLRVQAAKRLLLTSRLSVTDICFDLGYDSLGTFTRRFTQFVGVSPNRLRRLVEAGPLPSFSVLEEHCARARKARTGAHRIEGRVSGRTPSEGPIFVGAFRTPIPLGQPAGCTLLTATGPFKITGVARGSHFVFSAAFPWSDEPLAYLLPDESRHYVGTAAADIGAGTPQASARAEVELRPLRITDPPIVVALPLLLLKHYPAP
jgi:AraC-like DNA-binding protein